MNDPNKKKQDNRETFQIPYSLGKLKEDINFTSNKSKKLAKAKVIEQAFRFHSEKNITEATKYYKYFISQGFKDHRVFSNYGTILKHLGKLEEAERSLRKAIELKPNSAQAHSNLGNILRDLGKLEEAERSLRKAIALNPDYTDAYLNLGNILNDMGKLEEAELSLRKAIELNPDYADAYKPFYHKAP